MHFNNLAKFSQLKYSNPIKHYKQTDQLQVVIVSLNNKVVN